MFERLAILGAGAIGSVTGGYLARAGHDVTFIDTWGAHVDAMQQKGLRITAQEEEFTVPVKAMHLGDVGTIADPFDAVFLAVKSYDTVWSVHLILPYLSPTGVIVSAQNAVNDELIAPIVGFTRTIGCVVTIGAAIDDPGHVLRTSAAKRLAYTVGELNGMATQRAKVLADMLGVIGPTKVTTNLWGERWAKLGTNCMANPVASITGLGSAAIRLNHATVKLSIRIAAEVVRVGEALGVQVEPITGIPAETFTRADDGHVMEEITTQLAETAKVLGDGRPSMYQDVLKGRRTEIDYLSGYVARRGLEAGVPTPLNAAIAQLLRRVERGELKPGMSNLKRLEPYL